MFVVTSILFFLNDTATTEIYTLSLLDALPIFVFQTGVAATYATLTRRPPRPSNRSDTVFFWVSWPVASTPRAWRRDRKSTRLNSSHANISYAVFCLKKKKILISIQHAKRLPDL